MSFIERRRWRFMGEHIHAVSFGFLLEKLIIYYATINLHLTHLMLNMRSNLVMHIIHSVVAVFPYTEDI